MVSCMAFIVTLPTLWLALTLVTNQIAYGVWIALALGLAAWGWLAGRALAQSLTLTADTVVIRNIFTTERVPLADVTEVSFHRGRLKVTSQHGTFAPERVGVGAVSLGSSYWSGRRSNADTTAEAITAAAGLPPLPPRREIIGRSRARTILLAAPVVLGFGLYLGPFAGIHHRSLALTEAGAMLYLAGIYALGFAFRLARDHRRKRLAQNYCVSKHPENDNLENDI
jgi:hypothetical protein